MMEQEADRLWDSYFYPETNVLINNFGYKNQEELRKAEASYSFDRLLELRNKPLDMNFDKQHLREIHRYIFREIYPFAGEYRKVNLAKERGRHLRELENQLKKKKKKVEEITTKRKLMELLMS